MLEGFVAGIITKEEGRKLIMQTPIENFRKVAEYPRKSFINNRGNMRTMFYCIDYHSIKLCINSSLAILSLFNDRCDISGLEFTHYAIMKHDNQQKCYTLVPIKFDLNGNIIDFNIDHIYPKSKGGSNCLMNYRLTTKMNNNVRGDKMTNDDMKYGITTIEYSKYLQNIA